jgi:hypothetical protein
MMIHWENIHWETDDAGTSWATLADEEHNSLTLENRDGMITFHTDGSPRFDVSTFLDITALCVILSKNTLGQVGRSHQDRVTTRRERTYNAEMLVPGQRHSPVSEQHAEQS